MKIRVRMEVDRTTYEVEAKHADTALYALFHVIAKLDTRYEQIVTDKDGNHG